MSRTCCSMLLAVWFLPGTIAVASPPLSALIVDGQNNQHDWKRTTLLLEKQLQQTGLFAVDVTTAPPQGNHLAGFSPKFSGHHVVVLNYGYQGEPWPEEIRVALEQYVSGGGGLVVYHAASSAFPEWKGYNEMAGVGGWCGRNEKDGPYLVWRDGKITRDMTPGPAGTHGPQHPFQLVVREPNHPITQGLPEKFMHAADELYSRLRGPARNLTVLATSRIPKDQGGTGEHEPTLMVIRYGKGRVFHTTLGHGPEQLQSPAFRVTFQRGTEWAATGNVTQKIPDGFPNQETSGIP